MNDTEHAAVQISYPQQATRCKLGAHRSRHGVLQHAQGRRHAPRLGKSLWLHYTVAKHSTATEHPKEIPANILATATQTMSVQIACTFGLITRALPVTDALIHSINHFLAHQAAWL